MSSRLSAVCAVSAALLSAASSSMALVPIYGKDNRQEPHQVTDPKIPELARSVPAMFYKSDVKIEGAAAVLPKGKLGPKLNLSSTERFYDQPSGAFCSAVLVGPDVVATAGHCIETLEECRDGIRFVFDYAISKAGHDPTSVSSTSVYGCKDLLKGEERWMKPNHWGGSSVIPGSTTVTGGADWVLVRLDRAALGRTPVKINASGGLKKGAKLFMLGYPGGIPLKVTDGATVRHAGYDEFFISDLDIFKGNSGGAVFNAETYLLEGIAVRLGEKDYVADIPEDMPPFIRELFKGMEDLLPRKANVLGQDQGWGADSTKASRFAKQLEDILAGKDVGPGWDGSKAESKRQLDERIQELRKETLERLRTLSEPLDKAEDFHSPAPPLERKTAPVWKTYDFDDRPWKRRLMNPYQRLPGAPPKDVPPPPEGLPQP